MKRHVVVAGAAGYLGSLLRETQRSLNDSIQDLPKGYSMLGRSPWKNV